MPDPTPVLPPATPNDLAVTIPVGVGELIDKIVILEIKAARFADPGKLGNVRRELSALAAARARHVPPSPDLDALEASLKAVNLRLWDAEEALRDHERAADFGPGFVRLARSVYRLNDERAALKRRINLAAGSRLIEEKGYGEPPAP